MAVPSLDLYPRGTRSHRGSAVKVFWVALGRVSVFILMFWWGPALVLDAQDDWARFSSPLFWSLGVFMILALTALVWWDERGSRS